MEGRSQTSVNLFLGDLAPSCVFAGTRHAHIHASRHTYMHTYIHADKTYIDMKEMWSINIEK